MPAVDAETLRQLVGKLPDMIAGMPWHVTLLAIATALVLAYLRIFRILEFVILVVVSFVGWSYFFGQKPLPLPGADRLGIGAPGRPALAAGPQAGQPAPPDSAPSYNADDRQNLERLLGGRR